MIIVNLIGGLGNQLFQYSLGRRLALKNKTGLRLDIFDFKNYENRSFLLDNFNIRESLATKLEIMRLKFMSSFGSKPYYEKSAIYEKSLSFDPNILHAPANCYLKGYWQSERYFKDIDDVIRSEITLKNPPSPEYLKISQDIHNSNSVSLHIRRSDYLSGKNKNIFAECSPDYYNKAIDEISKKVGNIKLYLFSDDIDWVKNNLQLSYPSEFVSDKKLPVYEELMLMSSCKHNVIANSSFSWWGAWLNNNSQKIVIAPEKWFLGPEINPRFQSSDIVPSSWLKM